MKAHVQLEGVRDIDVYYDAVVLHFDSFILIIKIDTEKLLEKLEEMWRLIRGEKSER